MHLALWWFQICLMHSVCSVHLNIHPEAPNMSNALYVLCAPTLTPGTMMVPNTSNVHPNWHPGWNENRVQCAACGHWSPRITKTHSQSCNSPNCGSWSLMVNSPCVIQTHFYFPPGHGRYMACPPGLRVHQLIIYNPASQEPVSNWLLPHWPGLSLVPNLTPMCIISVHKKEKEMIKWKQAAQFPGGASADWAD